MDVATAKALSSEEINEHYHASSVDPQAAEQFKCIHCDGIAEVFLYDKTRICTGDNFFYTCLEHCKHEDIDFLNDNNADKDLHMDNSSEDSDGTETETEEALTEKDAEEKEEEAGDGHVLQKSVFSASQFSFCYDKYQQKKCYKKECAFTSRSYLRVKRPTARACVNSIFNLYFCETHIGMGANQLESKGCKRVKAAPEHVDTSKLVCDVPSMNFGTCCFLSCNNTSAAQYTDTRFITDTYIVCKQHQRQFYGRTRASAASSHNQEDDTAKKGKTSDASSHIQGDDKAKKGKTSDLTEEEKSDYKANRLFEVKKGKKKENHWRGIKLVAKDDKVGNATKSSDAICAYCSLCDTFFPYHHSSNSKAPANHKKKCTGEIALQSEEVRKQLREKEKVQQDIEQKLSEVQADLNAKEKESHNLQGKAAQFKACQEENKVLSDELAKSKTEVRRLKEQLEISQKTTTNLQTQLAESDQSVELARLQGTVSDLNGHLAAAKRQHKSELDRLDLQIADLNQTTSELKRKISTIQSESEDKLKKMKSDLDEKEAENTRLESENTRLQTAGSHKESENTSLMSQVTGLRSELALAKEFSDRQAENLVTARAQLLQMQREFPVVQQNGSSDRLRSSERDRSHRRSRHSSSRRHRRHSRSYSRS